MAVHANGTVPAGTRTGLVGARVDIKFRERIL